MRGADLILTNGPIYTGDTSQPLAEAVAVAAGRIIHVGSLANARPYQTRQTRMIDLAGQMLLPSFFEAHAHPSFVIEHDYRAWLCNDHTLPDYLQALHDFTAANPQASVIRGFGWNNAVFGPQGPRKESLDGISQDRPVVIHSLDHHSLWINSAALALAGITRDTVVPPGSTIEHDENGEPSGTLREDDAMNLVLRKLPDYSIAEYKSSILNYQALAQTLGFTGVMDALVAVNGNCYRAYQELAAENKLAMYFHLGFHIEPDKFPAQLAWIQAERLRLSMGGDLSSDPTRNPAHPAAGVSANPSAGMPAGPSLLVTHIAKFFVDGVIEGSTAWLTEPYSHRPDWYGQPVWNESSLQVAFALCHDLQLQIHAHSIGDASTRMVLDCLARLPVASRQNRHALTHLQLVQPADFPRFAELGLIATVNPYWAMKEKTFAAVEGHYLGARAEQMYPIQSFCRHQVIVATASDYPITIDPDPLYAMEVAVTRTAPRISRGPRSEAECTLNPGEAIDLPTAIRSSTINPAYAYYRETETGSITVGKSADLVILDKNILALPDAESSKAQVTATYFRGKQVYPAPGSRK